MEQKKATVPGILNAKGTGKPIVAITAYDFPFARIVDEAGVDLILVGDSLGMVVQGLDTTLPVTVEEVIYPELPGHPDHELAKQLLPSGCGAVFSFVVKGGRAAGRKFIERLSLFSHLANVGDAKSLVIHPASTTHHRMDAAALEAAGIKEGTIRLSVGIEDPDDLIGDLGRALHASQKG